MGKRSISGPGSARTAIWHGAMNLLQFFPVPPDIFETTWSVHIVNDFHRSMFCPDRVRPRCDEDMEFTSGPTATLSRLSQELPIDGRSRSRGGMTCTARGLAFRIPILSLSNDNVRPAQKLGSAVDLYRDIDNNTVKSW